MNELAELVVTYGVPGLLVTAALFGAAPKFVVHLLVMVYPRKHSRRRELLAELEVVPYRDRLTWVAGQVVTVLFDGLPVRINDLRARWQLRNEQRAHVRGLPDLEERLRQMLLETGGRPQSHITVRSHYAYKGLRRRRSLTEVVDLIGASGQLIHIKWVDGIRQADDGSSRQGS